MPVTATKGFTGSGASVSIANTIGTVVTNVIAQVKSVSWSAPKTKTENCTTLSSPVMGAVTFEENLPTSAEPGQFSGTVVYLPTDLGQQALTTAFQSATPYTFTIQFPAIAALGQSTTGDKYVFTGYVLEYPLPDSIDPTKITTAKFTVQITSTIVRTAGS
jgi:hypothetical protein